MTRHLLRASRLWGSLWALAMLICVPAADAQQRPNFIFIFIDDLGYGDFSCYGNEWIRTPRVDQLAVQGCRFTQFYVNSPICSPSRVAVMTGHYPQRYGVFGHFASRAQNRRRQMVDYLPADAVTLPRLLQEAGYATAHFGKWHLGGGRDVDDAPRPQAYGLQESLVSMEGLGDRLLEPDGGLNDASAELGQGAVRRVPKHAMTQLWADRTIEFVRRHRDRPFYVHFWPRDVHDAFKPSAAQLASFRGKFAQFANAQEWERFAAVLTALDQQIGRVVDAVDEADLGRRTMILVTGDNGPTAWTRYYRGGLGEDAAPGFTGGLRGRKWSLYEGGIRQPLIVRWTDQVPAGRVNENTVLAAVDLLPSLCGLAGVPLPSQYRADGEDLHQALLGRAKVARTRPLFWEYNSLGGNIRPGLQKDRSPVLAVRDGDFKLLTNTDGTQVELYDLSSDRGESHDLAAERPQLAAEYRDWVVKWYREVMHRGQR